MFSFLKCAALRWLFRYLISFGGQGSDGSAVTHNAVNCVGLCGILLFACEISHYSIRNVGNY